MTERPARICTEVRAAKNSIERMVLCEGGA